MEYVYTAMLLHKTGATINEENVTKVLTAAGVKPDETRVKALVAALDGVDIDQAIEKAAVVAPAAAAPAVTDQAAEPKAEKKEEKKEDPAAAAAGLGALFG